MGILNVRALRDWILLRGVNHMMATEKGFFMDARLGPVIQRELDTLKERVGEINSNLSRITYGAGTLHFTNAGMLSCSLFFSSGAKLEALSVIPCIANDAFMERKDITQIIILPIGANAVQVRMYSTSYSFTQDDAVDFYYTLVTS